MLQTIKPTSYSNHHPIIGSFSGIYYLIKLLINKPIFYEHLGRDSSKSLLPGLLINNIALLAREYY